MNSESAIESLIDTLKDYPELDCQAVRLCINMVISSYHYNSILGGVKPEDWLKAITNKIKEANYEKNNNR